MTWLAYGVRYWWPEKPSRDQSELKHRLLHLRICNISLIRGIFFFSKVNQTPWNLSTFKPWQRVVQRRHFKGSWLWESPSENISWLFSRLKAFLGFRNRFRVIHCLGRLPAFAPSLFTEFFSLYFQPSSWLLLWRGRFIRNQTWNRRMST